MEGEERSGGQRVGRHSTLKEWCDLRVSGESYELRVRRKEERETGWNGDPDLDQVWAIHIARGDLFFSLHHYSTLPHPPLPH